MRTPSPQFRFRAVSMELAAQLEDRRVDMLVVTADGTTIAVECANDAILKIQEHIAQILRQCPEIGRWAAGTADETRFDAAVSEGWVAIERACSLRNSVTPLPPL